MSKQSPHLLTPLHVLSNNGFITLWSLRILISLNLFDRFIDRFGGAHNAEILQSIGLESFFDENINYTDSIRTQCKQQLKAYLHKLSKEITDNKATDLFSKNIKVLQKSLSLDKTDVELLRFVAAATHSMGFSFMSEMIGELTYPQTKSSLAIILDVPYKNIEQTLSANSSLLSSGLLTIAIGEGQHATLGNRLDVPENIRQALSREHKNNTSMLECFFRPSPKAKLGIKDFAHIKTDFNLIRQYLNAVIKNKTKGVNILIYGSPGSGKTELVRTVCKQKNLKLHELTMQDENGSPIDSSNRFAVLQLSQKLLMGEKNNVMMFDEIEDVFPTPDYGYLTQPTGYTSKKAWINHLLEENHIPTFWISNSVTQIDPSYLRRFDFVLKLRPLSPKVRLRILKKYLGHLPISESWLKTMAENESLAPAIAESAAKVVGHLEIKSPKETEQILQKVINNSLEVMGLPKNKLIKAKQYAHYNLAYLNPNYDLAKLCSGLTHNSQARLCLYGVPGSGKTAFAHYLANELDKPILVKRASDILSKWVGESEQNIADMFAQASAEEAILLLDEADSFLAERMATQYSWEITQVNELLVQMETFNGIFIASTNLMDKLDSASLRRFDFKIKFDYMKPAQRLSMFEQVIQEHGNTKINPQDYQQSLMKLDTLTPGDFATVIRQHINLGQKLTPNKLLNSLIKECQAKPNASHSIGFI